MLVLFVVLITTANCWFYLPGVAPKDYTKGETVTLKVNKLDSAITQLPYSYYSVPYCQPKVIKDMRENLGEILVGDRIENSVYEIKALTPVKCAVACSVKLDKDTREPFSSFIKDDYQVHWILDNLPAGYARWYKKTAGGKKENVYEAGFPMGCVGGAKGVCENKEKGHVFLHNHVDIRIHYHKHGNEKVRIVQFEVIPKSFANGNTAKCAKDDSNMLDISNEAITDFSFTYDVSWVPSTQKWATRWDMFLRSTTEDKQIHWFSIVNSLMIVLFLSGIVALIMMKTISSDFRKYRELETAEEAQEETGWKLVHADVFRPPKYFMLLSVLVGNGYQVLTMTAAILAIALLGFVSPANRGALLTSMVVLYFLAGSQAGYASSRLYKMMKGNLWKRNTVQTALLVPGTCLTVFFVLNLGLVAEKSSAAVGFVTLFIIALLWIGISLPLVFVGSYFGYGRETIEAPCKVNVIPRQVPPQTWYSGALVSILIGGILPFGAIFIELFFILSSIWLHQFYYLFPFLGVVFLILIVTCAEITIVMTYFQLCGEDYRWWWRSFLTSGASAFYVFLYSAIYFFTRLNITSWASALLFFGYTFILSFLFFVMTGTVGFISCYWFISKIYSVIKSD